MRQTRQTNGQTDSTLSKHDIFILAALEMAEQRRLDRCPARGHRLRDSLHLLKIALDTVYVVGQFLDERRQLLILLKG